MRYPKPAPYTQLVPFFEYEPEAVVVIRPLEEEIWAVIRLLAVEKVCLRQLRRRFPKRGEGPSAKIASKIRSCITLAEEYFVLAAGSSPRTAPLLYYYSMLNIAKALIYLAAPDRLSSPNDFGHGLSDPERVKDRDKFSLDHETVRVHEGVFRSLHYVLTGEELAVRTSIPLTDLFQYCISISHELKQVAGINSRLIDAQFGIAHDRKGKRIRLTIRIPRTWVKHRCGTISTFEAEVPYFTSLFTRVASDDAATLQYESQPTTYKDRASFRAAIPGFRERLRDLRLYRYPTQSKPDNFKEYLIPLSIGGSKPLPEPCVLLAVAFYLGSLVRYQPHICDDLLGSQENWILESFVRQCPLTFYHVMVNHLWRSEHLFVRS